MSVREGQIGALPAAAVRERCRALGLPTWRCDRTGQITADPEEKGPAGLWLRSRAITRRVAELVCGWDGQAGPEVAELFTGCWVIPLAESHRRERVGYTVALALSRAALDDEWFTLGCTSAQLDARALRAAMEPLARFHADSARDTARMLRWMLADLERSHEDHETIAGFTRQLTDGFETIDLLYTLGRSMNDLSRPNQFVRLAVERLHASMAFGWMAGWFGGDPRTAAIAGAEPVVLGRVPLEGAALERVLRRLGERAGRELKALILSSAEDPEIPAGSQVLVQPVTRASRVVGLLVAGDKGGDDPQVSSYDIHLLEAAGGYIGAFLDNAVLYADQRAMFVGTLRAMTASIDAKDRYTRGHSERVAHLSRQLARAAGLDDAVAERLHICGLVHDVGKIGVPEAVLGKAGRLTPEEFAAIKRHPEIGWLILRDIPQLADILPGVLHHHERFDGRGYPRGLSGTEIPLFGRLIALADTFDAMSSTRSYRAAMPRQRVLDEIRRCSGTQFDPQLAGVFAGLEFGGYDELVARHAAAEARPAAA